MRGVYFYFYFNHRLPYNPLMNNRIDIHRSKILLTYIIATMIMLFNINKLNAATNLSVNPMEGGNSLRFGRVDLTALVNKEVRIRVSSSEGKQYQVFQRILEPLINERGLTLNPDGLRSYTMSGSNTAGTLYGQDQASLGYVEQLLYTSGPSGDSDSFTVVYSVDKSRINVSGNFLGKIFYTLRPIGGNAQQEIFLDVNLNISEEKKLDLEASSGRELVRLSTQNLQDQKGYLKLAFAGNRGSIRIYQEMEEPPRDELNHEMNLDNLRFWVEAASQSENSYRTPTRWAGKRQLVYSSQEPTDSLLINFDFDPNQIVNQKAGLYRGRMRYVVESEELNEMAHINLEAEVNPIFKLDVQYPPGGMHFSNLLPGESPQVKEIEVKVKSNLGRPYMVTQNVSTTLTNDKGEKISAEFFSMKVGMDQDISGKTDFSGFSSVPRDAVPIYFSNAKGASTSFKVMYRLAPYPGMAPGDYSTAIVYTLEEM